MVLTLEEVKLYLRVDGDEEDALITKFMLTSEDLCEGILRYELSEFETVPEVVKQAVMYAVANMYERREEIDVKEVVNIMIRLISNYRKQRW